MKAFKKDNWFIKYMNKPSKPMTAGHFALWSLLINTAMWTIIFYIGFMAMVAVFLAPLHIIVGGFKWIFG